VLVALGSRSPMLVSATFVAAALVVLPGRPADAATVRVTAADLSFTPQTARVLLTEGEPGFPSPHAHVVWTMGDAEEHTITFDDTSLPSSGPLGPGRIHDAVLTRAGTFSYRCLIHPSMTGTVVVIAPAPTTTTTLAATTTTADAVPSSPSVSGPAVTSPPTQAPLAASTTTTRPTTATTATTGSTTTPTAPVPAGPAAFVPPVAPTGPPTVPSSLLRPTRPSTTTTTTAAVVDAQSASPSDATADGSSGPGPAPALGLLVVLVGGGAIVVARRAKEPGK